MHSRPSQRRTSARGAARAAAAVVVAVLPAAILGRLLRAEGPTAALAAWGASVAAFAAFAAETGSGGTARKRLRTLSALIAGISGGAGACVALVQLNVARRSLAEAWIELARKGEAFGFFSFFACELCALFCLGSSFLIIAGRTAAALAALIASLSFTGGIILGDWRLLALALASGAAVPVLASRGLQGGGPWKRLRSALPPAAAALIACVPFAFMEESGVSGPLLRPVDLTPIVRAVAPAFPLLLDVPGYGYEFDASRISASVYLSEGALFDAEGDGSGLRYVVASVYSDWTGDGWRETEAAGRPVAVRRFVAPPPRPPGALRLRLAEDFYSVVPVERNTVSVSLSADAPEAESASLNRGVRFAGSGRRGFVADLESGGDASAAPAAEADADLGGGRWLIPGPDASGRLSSLAADLARRGEEAAREGSGKRDRAVAEAILEHLKAGFSYALNVAPSKDSALAIDRFLFEDRRGYCLHYATAFVLLARRAGISARVVEGFRLSLDERGRGTVRGVDAHAWPEAWVDGAWRVFEPTPPFASRDPFAYLDGRDSAARRQLEALFGRSAEPAESRAVPRLPTAAILIGIACLAAAAASAFAAVRIRGSRGLPAAVRATKRRAARIVAHSRRAGIPGPELLGWTGWAARVREILDEERPTARRRPVPSFLRQPGLGDAVEISEKMLRIAFDPSGNEGPRINGP